MLLKEKAAVITLHQLTMSYDQHSVLNGIDLNIYCGDIIGYIGPNGAGKSTTIKIILGLIEDYGGEVEILGESIRNGNQSYKRKIGYVPESADIYEQLTPSEYLSFVGTLYGMDNKTAQEKAFHLLKLLGLEGAFHQRIDSFSKGMRQKVLIVSSLLHNPDIIFLDEPLNGLDANSVSVIKQILKALADKGKTIFFCSHVMEVVENLSSRIILLSGGEIAADGEVAQLKSERGKDSLEGIFNELTGFHHQTDTVKNFVKYVLDVDGEVTDHA